MLISTCHLTFYMRICLSIFIPTGRYKTGKSRDVKKTNMQIPIAEKIEHPPLQETDIQENVASKKRPSK